MKLSAGQRIGIILSAAWAIAAYVTVTKLEYDIAAHQVALTHRLCMEAKAKAVIGSPDCAKEKEKTWHNWTDGTFFEAAAIALLPIPFAWVFADFVNWLVALIKGRSRP
jgi:hypothetical protein